MIATSPFIGNLNSLKLTLPNIPKIGEIILVVKLVTMLWKAAPIITPTAKSSTLPLNTNFLNSVTNPLALSVCFFKIFLFDF